MATAILRCPQIVAAVAQLGPVQLRCCSNKRNGLFFEFGFLMAAATNGNKGGNNGG